MRPISAALLGALGGCAVGAALVTLIYRRRAHQAGRTSPNLKMGAKQEEQEGGKQKEKDLLMEEQLTRNRQFFGDDGQEKVAGSYVVIIGLGGVGSHVALALGRSGVGKLRLVDFDQVSLSSLNRHAVADRSDVGISKTACLKKHIGQINPDCEVICDDIMFSNDNAEQILLKPSPPDFVIDCIDNMQTKVDLLAFCLEQHIPVVSSGGAACKCDPTKIQIANLFDAAHADGFTRTLRKSLRSRGAQGDIPFIFSSEVASRKLLPLEGEQAESPQDFQIMPNFRVRLLPVIVPIPAIFGHAIASYTLCQMAQQPFVTTYAANGINGSTANKILQQLRAREQKNHGDPCLHISVSDTLFLVTQVWCCRSAATGKKDNLKLTRWKKDQAAALTNLVLLTKDECEKYEADIPLKAVDMSEMSTLVEKRIALVRDGSLRPSSTD